MKIRNAFIAVVLLTLFTSRGYGGAPHVDCLNPIAYPDAAINVVFLPFEMASDASGKKTGYFAELSLLMQLDTLLHLLPYGSVGAVQADPPAYNSTDCNAEEVTRRLFGRNQIMPNRGLIVVSGLLYQEGNDYYVKTFARFQRRDASEQIKFPMDGLVLVASPSTQTVSFQPRHLTRDQLHQLEEAYQKANVIRAEPSLDSPGTPIPTPFARCSNGNCTADNPRFRVKEHRGQWFRIEWIAPADGGRQRDGWILAGADMGSEHLENFMPELYFIQGLAGYIVSRMQDPHASESKHILNTLSEQFAHYIDREKDDDETKALAYELRGISTATLQQGDSGVADFDKAVPLDPSSADMRNLQVCAQIWNAWRTKSSGSAIDGKEVIKGFLSAVALSGENHPAATNLSVFYQAAQKRIVINTGLSQEEIQAGITQVKRQ